MPTPLLRVGPAVRAAAALAVLLLVWACVVLPAGSVQGVNVKFLLFGVAALALAFDSIVNPRTSVASYRHVLGLGLAIAAVTLGLIVALARQAVPLSYTVGSLQGFLATIGVAYVIIIAVARGTVSWRAVIRAFLLAVLVYAAIKIAIAALVFVGLVGFPAVRAFFVGVFDYSFVSMLILPGLVRIQFVNDVALPFALMALVVLRRPDVRPLRPLTTAVLVVAILIATVLAFSRWLFFLTAVVAGLWLLLYAIRRTTSLVWFSAIASVGVAAGLAFADLSRPLDALVARFTSPAVEASDALRTVQIEALLTEITRAPLLGSGLGAYAPSVIQRATEPYSYEVQWLAILLQLGIVGTTLVAVPLLGLLVAAARVSEARAAAVLLTMTGLWLASGFTNPYLISSTSGVVFGVLATVPLALRANASVPLALRSTASPPVQAPP